MKPVVYIIDDNEMVGLLLMKNFQDDFDISVFLTEEEVVNQINSQRPDFFIIDYQLEKMTGLELYYLNEEQLEGTEIIFLSAQNDVSVVYEIINSKVGEYVIKDELMINSLRLLLNGDIESFKELL